MLFKNDYISLLEQELLSEECQIFTEAFLDERYDEIDYEVPMLEVIALHDIVSKISALQDGILEEEIAVYADHETIDDYILSLMEFYEVEDPETLLETAQEVLDEMFAGMNPKSAVDAYASSVKMGEEIAKRGRKFRKTISDVFRGRKKVTLNPETGTINLPKSTSTKIDYSKVEDIPDLKSVLPKHKVPVTQQIKNVGNNKWLRRGAGVGALGATGTAGYSAGQNTGVASVPKPVPAPSVYDRVKGMGGDAKRAIMNNKGLALKTLGGAAAAGGLGYLAYKLWKNRKNKQADKFK